MTFAQQRNPLMTHFSEPIPIVKRRISVLVEGTLEWALQCPFALRILLDCYLMMLAIPEII